MVLLELDPNVVRPGWTPLLITIGIAVVLVLLFVSMRRQFNRIDVSQSQPGVTDPEVTDPQLTNPASAEAGDGSAATHHDVQPVVTPAPAGTADPRS